jgi:hypothetical protein
MSKHRHDWRVPHCVVGGLRENPGVWGLPSGVELNDVCAKCGAWRTIRSYGCGARRERQIMYLHELDAERQERVRSWLAGQSDD